MKKILLLLAFMLFVSSCQEEGEVQTEATIIELSDLKSQIGYAAFDLEYNEYESDTVLVEAIKNAYVEDEMDFLMFIKPTCKCLGNTEKVPVLYRILNDAGISDDKITLYSMRVAELKHPYEANINIVDLPSFYLVKNEIDFTELFASFDPNDSTGTNLETLILEAMEQ